MNASSWLKAVVFLTKNKKQIKTPKSPGWLIAELHVGVRENCKIYVETDMLSLRSWLGRATGSKEEKMSHLTFPQTERTSGGTYLPLGLWSERIKWLVGSCLPNPRCPQFSVTPWLMLLWVPSGPWDPLTNSMLSLHGPSRDHNLKGWTRITSTLS